MPVRNGNIFAALASDSSDSSDSSDASDSESSIHEAQPLPSVSASPPFRVWKVDEGEKRFAAAASSDNTNIFSSPFSRKKVTWSRPRFKNEDAEGWVSIQVGLPSPKAKSEEAFASREAAFASREADNYDDCPDYAPPTPPFLEAESPEKLEDIPTLSLPPQEFPSLLVRGVSSASVAASATAEDQRVALAWAEKIKNNLEKAEKARGDFKKNKDESSKFDSGLSFFRRGANK